MMGVLAMIAAASGSLDTPADPEVVSCSAEPVLPVAWQRWPMRIGLVASTTTTTMPVMRVGQAFDVTLASSHVVRFASPPARAPGVDGHAGLVELNVVQPGQHQVALSAGAWIDVVQDGRSIASIDHGHGPECSGIRKIVTFNLQPGRYVIQLSGAQDPALVMMVRRREARELRQPAGM